MKEEKGAEMKTKKSGSRRKLVRGLTVALVAGALAALCTLAACSPQENTESGSDDATASAEEGYVIETPVTAEADEIPTMSKHEEFDVECIDCHGEEDPTSAPTSNEACLSCHDYEAIVGATEYMEDTENREVNPHDNHMHGASCFSCHSEHGESTVACNECHTNEYDWIVP